MTSDFRFHINWWSVASTRLVRVAFLFSIFLFGGLFPSQAGQPLVSAQWLNDHLMDENLRVIDLQQPEGYAKIHIDGAVNSQFARWRQPKPKEGLVLPNTPYLERLIGSLGIDNDTHVILAPIGFNASEIAIATRIYWTFKVLGHENISILDGGLIAFSKLKSARWSKQTVTVSPASYVAKPDLSMAPKAKDVLAEWEKGTSLVDYRSPAEFYGKAGGTRPGTIPGAKNLPFSLLVEPVQGGHFLPKSRVEEIFAKHDVPTSGEQVAFCNSGHRASLGWFVSHEILGNKSVRLYDGSMNEWAQYPDYPVDIPKD
ncbi:rhodanese-like domain-containing protein [uncultured Cohaesibacter sp.]|uniref:sulfurtransferase n=1 Tax=uncultured Cohaesibacter sp. TaxID=1002546 RepID=UPI002931C257|nr:rhodanese-like domain-containing protein [uncultured Cohaesibacter sp.]